MRIYRVIIVDDHQIFRNGLRLLLNKIDDIEVVEEASNGMEFLDKIKKTDIDLAFLDISMPVLDGINAMGEVIKIKPEMKIIVLSTFGDPEYIDKMIYAGVAGYMLKNSGLEDFKKAIGKVMAGGNYFSDEILTQITKKLFSRQDEYRAQKLIEDLTKREKEVLGLICKGLSNQKIGEMLHISNRTVERHKTNLLLKTGTVNSLNLAIFAFNNRLVEISI